MDKKTRKNKTNLVIAWPSENEFWTVKQLMSRNKQFVPITLRVRLSNAINKHNTVAVIGDKMNSHGRPEMVLAMRNKDGKVNPAVIEAAKKAGIRCGEPITVPVATVTTSTPSIEQPVAVNLNPTQKPVAA